MWSAVMKKFKDEFHTRFPFRRRGSIAVAEMTMIPNSTLLLLLHQNCRIDPIFGKATGETIYSMLKLKEALVDENVGPLYAPKMIKAELLNNPFSDIIPRMIVQESEEVKDSSKTKTVGVKNFNLLSFDKEAEEDEEESAILNKKFSGRSKSVLDHLTDPKLSS
ncbi:Peptidyl-prolyl cis-trans isomerase CWC27 like protein [Eufriesea mexicana]|nr:Peptidyl-prolyl cis-trans isomerase CWC27 like protein [Eufriesea mexicana]